VGLKVQQRTDKEATRQPTIGDHTKRSCNTDHITAGLCVKWRLQASFEQCVWVTRRQDFFVHCFDDLRLKVNRIHMMDFEMIQKEAFWLDERFTLALS
jgi:hypothetical protein